MNRSALSLLFFVSVAFFAPNVFKRLGTNTYADV